MTDEVKAGDVILSAGRRYRIYYSCSACEWCASDLQSGCITPLGDLTEFKVVMRFDTERQLWKEEEKRFKDENPRKRVNGAYAADPKASTLEKLRALQRRQFPFLVRKKISQVLDRYLDAGLDEEGQRWLDAMYFYNKEVVEQ